MNMRPATKTISIFSILALVLTLAACAAAQDTIEGKWKISSYNFADKRAFPLEKMEVTLTVDHDMHIGGRSACNIYSGSVAVGAGGAMKLGSMTTTEMACNEVNGTFEGDFLDVLNKASRYDVKGGTLTITDTATGHFLRFVRDDKPAPTQTQTPRPKVEGEREIFFVGNKMSKCSGVQPLKCLLIKKGKGDAWQDYYDSIIDFTPKAGRFYKIEVVRVGDPPSGLPGDVTVYRHKLVRILKSSTRERDIYR
jgi:heat shock protein HslJ